MNRALIIMDRESLVRLLQQMLGAHLHHRTANQVSLLYGEIPQPSALRSLSENARHRHHFGTATRTMEDSRIDHQAGQVDRQRSETKQGPKVRDGSVETALEIDSRR